MPVTIELLDEPEFIGLMTINAPWTWDDMLDALWEWNRMQAEHMQDSYLIVDQSLGGPLPDGVVRQMAEIFKTRSKYERATLIFGLKSLEERAALRMFARLFGNIHAVTGIQAGLAYIRNTLK